jgi:hypothetical protein
MFTGELSLPPPSEDLDQWFTRPKVADAFARFAGIKSGMRVLEPSAGEGALLKSAPWANWTAVELCRARAQWIKKHELSREVFHEDFLKFAPELARRGPFELVHQNPPYSDGLDTDFVEACIANRLAPRITGLLVTNFLHTANRKKRIWRWVKLTRIEILSTRPQFGQANGKSEGPKRDYAFFEMMVRKTARREGAGDRPFVTWVDV